MVLYKEVLNQVNINKNMNNFKKKLKKKKEEFGVIKN